ncbi:carbon-nitrogen family hydrolase [Enterococcus alishanensis]|uniref:Carbon-nitrogen family hydrolase n=1 Tax=Enterococcus alishanensis TaxID=1303817 RepID=A0ABS6TBX4_9ENTE|nr:carbon-nitrogen family hydrolase [Enterococcus alishanensis]MBV7390402.1 carbon-nitrogen family hydrolase [Enterococcus alishanensis]
MKITVMQIDLAFGEPEKNFAHIKEIFSQQTFQPNQLVVLPEMWNTAYDLTRLSEIADEEGMETQVFFAELAQTHQIYIVAGSIARKVGAEFFNTAYTFNPKGEIVGDYDKVHLFGLMAEDQYLAAGDQATSFDWAGHQVSTVICYDLRFPEWFRKQGTTGTELFVVPAQWPKQRIQVWRKLLQARAIENQCYVLGVNRVGSDPNNQFNGHSMLADPFGEIVMELGENETVLQTEIDFSRLKEARKDIPVFNDRRPELY